MTAEKGDALIGARIKALLEEDGVKKALALLERRYYEDFKRAQSNDARLSAQAKALVLGDFGEQLMATVARGQAAQTTLDRETAKVKADEERKKRYGRA